ncbi:MAG: YicC family protein [Roseivirga sp.]
MLKSMTGFGQGQGQKDGLQVNVEIRSLNSKFLDANMKLPKQLQDRELEIRNILNSELVRGKVSLMIELTNQESVDERLVVNKPLFKAYFDDFVSIADEVGAEKKDLFRLALHSPDVLQGSEKSEEVLEREWNAVSGFLKEAIAQCNGFRASEGANLERELKQYITNIANYLEQIKGMDDDRVKVIRDRIHSHQNEILESDEFDKNRFEQEMIYYIEKLDISEELVRLKTHLDYFMEVMAEDKAHGKKLGFISQEIGREINTIGSKANYAPVQKCVVCMKDELEKIKEQLLNII